MTETAYYLRQQARVSGPFTAKELASLLRRGRVARSDKVSVDKVTWIAIADSPDVAPRAVQAPVASEFLPRNEDGIEWFYTSGGTEQPNPVGTNTILQLIAGGKVEPDDLVWRQGFEDWRPLINVEQFVAAVRASKQAAFSFPSAAESQPARRPGKRRSRRRWWDWFT